MIAKNLLAKLRMLTLVGQNNDGELEWIGTDKQWRWSELEEQGIDHDWNNNKPKITERIIEVCFVALKNLVKDYKKNYGKF